MIILVYVWNWVYYVLWMKYELKFFIKPGLGSCLTLYQKILDFDDPEVESF